MKPIKYLFLALIFVISTMLLSGILMVGTASQTTNVKVSPPAQNVSLGQSFSVNLTVEPHTAIAGAQFNLQFDPSLVQVNSVTEGNLFKQSGANTLFNPGTINNAAGTVTNVYGCILGKRNISTPGAFAIIDLTARTLVGESMLELFNVKITDSGGNAVPIIVSNGTFTIFNGPGPTPTPTPSPTPTPTPGGSGGGGGGGGGGFTIIQTPTPTPTANNTLNGSDSSVDCGDFGTCRLTNEAPENIVLQEGTSLNVSKGKNISFCFKEPGNDVVRINYTAKTNAGNINTTVEILKNTSSSVNVHVHAPEPDNVYLYFNVWVGPCGYATAQNIENTSTSIVFRVNKTWIRNNDLDPTKTRITLYRYEYYNKSWNVLPTIKIRDDQSYLYFRASPQSFGSFAITATAQKLVQKSPAQTSTLTPTPTEPTITETTTETENKLISIPRFYAIFGLVGLLIIAYRFRRKPSWLH